jgi:hypothetical protein
MRLHRPANWRMRLLIAVPARVGPGASRRRCRSTASWAPPPAARPSPGPVSSVSWRNDYPVFHPIRAMEPAPARSGLVPNGGRRYPGQGDLVGEGVLDRRIMDQRRHLGDVPAGVRHLVRRPHRQHGNERQHAACNDQQRRDRRPPAEPVPTRRRPRSSAASARRALPPECSPEPGPSLGGAWPCPPSVSDTVTSRQSSLPGAPPPRDDGPLQALI